MNLSYWLEKKNFDEFNQALTDSIKNSNMPKKGHAARTTVMLMQ